MVLFSARLPATCFGVLQEWWRGRTCGGACGFVASSRAGCGAWAGLVAGLLPRPRLLAATALLRECVSRCMR